MARFAKVSDFSGNMSAPTGVPVYIDLDSIVRVQFFPLNTSPPTEAAAISLSAGSPVAIVQVKDARDLDLIRKFLESRMHC